MLNRGWRLPWRAQKDELKVFTEFGKLHVEGNKEKQEDDGTFRHEECARSFLGSGHSQMIPKYEESNSQTDCSWYNWER
ncbi:MAG: hypothetical protein CM15mV22_1020 [Eurybiavirus sp.]|nr:MAG: hypothetical protein CM15mV22_1020 [Eurybiavirus sp.]